MMRVRNKTVWSAYLDFVFALLYRCHKDGEDSTKTITIQLDQIKCDRWNCISFCSTLSAHASGAAAVAETATKEASKSVVEQATSEVVDNAKDKAVAVAKEQANKVVDSAASKATDAMTKKATGEAGGVAADAVKAATN